MFKANETLTEYVDALVRACKPLNRGDFLTHEVVTGIVGVPPHTEHYQYCVNRLKRRMLAEREITLWPENGVGYRLLTIQEQITMVPMARMKRAKRHIRKGRNDAGAISDRHMTAHQRRVREAQLEALAASQREMIVQSRRQAVLAKEIETRAGRPAAVVRPNVQPN